MQTPEQEYALIFQGQVAEGQDVAEAFVLWPLLLPIVG